MKFTTDYDKNLIRISGNYDPFVYRDGDGIHIGDCDNHEVFQTVDEALDYARGACLSGGHLSKARAAAKNDPNGNAAAEYRWHEDAGLQIEALGRRSELQELVEAIEADE